jgi:mannose-1-phosphate guanylyltransferase/mannose-6-phosphate isomerase
MIAVIIAGGSGSRLWPISTPDYPKHLLRISPEENSLLQKTYSRVRKTADTIYVITEKSHAHHVKEQLPDVDGQHLIVEPGRRGTANCTLLALTAISKVHSPDEPIVILWADHYIRDVQGFSHNMRLASAASKREKKIVLVGVEPIHPATGFGYIKKGKLLSETDFVFCVDSFKEKPDRKLAKTYLKSGDYLWNSGYFIASLNTFLESMEQYAPKLLTSYKKLIQSDKDGRLASFYTDLEPSNIDNALIEKVADLLVVPATFDWMDLGTYIDLHKATGSDEKGNYVQGEQIKLSAVENSFIQNHEDKPLAVIGVDNIVVVNTKDGILVSRKDLSQEVGEVSKQLFKEE